MVVTKSIRFLELNNKENTVNNFPTASSPGEALSQRPFWLD